MLVTWHTGCPMRRYAPDNRFQATAVALGERFEMVLWEVPEPEGPIYVLTEAFNGANGVELTNVADYKTDWRAAVDDFYERKAAYEADLRETAERLAGWSI